MCRIQKVCDLCLPMDSDRKRRWKEFYREQLAVPLAGFGMAAILVGLFILLMTTLSHYVYVGGMR